MASQHDSSRSTSRQAALDNSRLLDSPHDPVADRITRLICTALQVPVGLISLVDHDRQFFLSQCGLPEPWASARETPLTHSFCQHVAQSGSPLVITDARESPLRDNLAIRDISVVAYCGVPIVDADGHVLGSMCAIDAKPREWSVIDVELLHALSAQFTADLQLREHSARTTRELLTLRDSEAERTALMRLNVHDLRTPLSGVLLGIDALRLLGPLNEAQERMLALTKSNGDTMLSMVNNLLDLGSLDRAGRDALHSESVRASTLIEKAIEQVRTLGAHKFLSISTTIDADPTLSVDRDRMTRVLVNLLANSIKFTHDGGWVKVIGGGLNTETRRYQFVVEDNGIGIANPERIFDEGISLDRTANARFSSGLGLTYAKRVVEAHDGRIWVQSEPGNGSKFFVEIPIG